MEERPRKLAMKATVFIPRHVRDAAAVIPPASLSSLSSPGPSARTLVLQDPRQSEGSGRIRRRLNAPVDGSSADRPRQHHLDSRQQQGEELPCSQSDQLLNRTQEQSDCDEKESNENRHPKSIVIGVVAHHPRLLFRAWKPRLMESPSRVARRVLERFLHTHYQQHDRAADCESRAIGVASAAVGRTSSLDSSAPQDRSTMNDRLDARTVRLFRRRRSLTASTSDRNAPLSVTIWIQPNHDATVLEKSWESRLIQWENQLIQAQSAAGFLSTLGGAYFLCHHLTSACVLAQQQRYLALVLNDPSMYYKCCVNQAYNLIYGGKFRYARKLLKQVERRVRNHAVHELSEESRTVILNMCESAKHFGRRVEKAATVLGTPDDQSHVEACDDTLEMSSAPNRDAGHQGQVLPPPKPALTSSHAPASKVVDDLARIRVYQDESRWQDMVVPFQRLSS